MIAPTPCPTLRACRHCHAPFEARTARNAFCSKRCRDRHRRAATRAATPDVRSNTGRPKLTDECYRCGAETIRGPRGDCLVCPVCLAGAAARIGVPVPDWIA